ncbi:MAG: NifB/NifX family molybdenum-iron cluster-binding protein [Deltaproteobacteria bacterium]|nr:NifB/NifX family molybdenum-iron cluster-binding protein [Deltaproteobacteria bacterium]
MKIAISSEGTDLKAQVGHRFGGSPYLIIVDLGTGNFEAVPNPGSLNQHGAGVQTIVLIISKGVKTALTGYCSPTARRHLEANGIEIFTGLSGTVKEVLESYKKGEIRKTEAATIEHEPEKRVVDKAILIHAMKRSGNQFTSMLPIFLGVVLLIGLLNTFVSRNFLAALFSGNPVLDTLLGAFFGSILAGNAINSYIIGGELLEYGVSLFTVTALIITWVTVGLVQLPVEIAALGRRFALLRNGICFILSIPIAIITVFIVNLVTR